MNLIEGYGVIWQDEGLWPSWTLQTRTRLSMAPLPDLVVAARIRRKTEVTLTASSRSYQCALPVSIVTILWVRHDFFWPVLKTMTVTMTLGTQTASANAVQFMWPARATYAIRLRRQRPIAARSVRLHQIDELAVGIATKHEHAAAAAGDGTSHFLAWHWKCRACCPGSARGIEDFDGPRRTNTASWIPTDRHNNRPNLALRNIANDFVRYGFSRSTAPVARLEAGLGSRQISIVVVQP